MKLKSSLSLSHKTYASQQRRFGAFFRVSGKLFVVIGVGGAGKALAYGAKEKGARVVIANRTYERAKELADTIGGHAISISELDNFRPESHMILANTTSMGMQPNVDETPISKVGFCNIIKKEKDRINHIWVVEATENSDYSLTYEHKRYIHLNHVVVASQKWAEVSSLVCIFLSCCIMCTSGFLFTYSDINLDVCFLKTIEKLKQKVISIIGKRT
ncbi:hypothetical protein POM88_015357 [Heracleum sosnowskyi]|uniref:Quinate/shikimate 5-dehydrogenase/glutamyl-tRNA reductase domain-containing protein n=1 Tax=Heracleum sosnowskyi TaxID=360622 RepID=A0AAD8ILH0_9APIA|nr:hypothetical protein POM88_015357 [Heracleum sosnowskyi]